MKKMIVENKRATIVLSIQAIVSLILILLVKRLDVFPTLIFILMVAVVTVLFLIMLLMQRTKKRKIFITGTVISIIISILLSYSSYLVYSGNSLLDRVTNITGRKTTLSVVVLKESTINTLDDLSGELFYSSVSADLVEKNQEHYTQNTAISLIQDADYLGMASGVLDGSKQAIIIDEAQREFINESVEGFSDKTKVIDKLEVTVKSTRKPKDVDITSESVNIFLSGIDTYGDPSVSSRTDSNMLLTYNPNTNQILLTSIPRDYYLPFPCTGNNYDKFTHSGIYGVDCSMETLEQLFGIDINYYVRVNFTGFMNIIDALGTIEVYSPVAFSTGPYSFKAGMNTMNSAQALAFSRERYALPGGDNDRVANQQRVITALINELTSPSVLMNYTDVLEAVGSNVVTSIPSSNISAFVKHQLDTGASLDIQSIALTGTGTQDKPSYAMPGYQLYVMIPNQASVDEAIRRINEVYNAK